MGAYDLQKSVSVSNMSLYFYLIQNDGPPTHMTSPEPVPLDFHVDRLTLTRGIDGVFRVSTGNNNIACQDSMSKL